MKTRPELLGYALAAIVIVCATILLGLGHNVPGEFYLLAGVGAGGSAGATTPRAAAP